MSLFDSARKKSVVGVLAVSLFVAGCGGGDDETTTTTAEPTTTTTTAVTTTLPELVAVLPHVHEGSTGSDPRAAGLVKDAVIVDQAGWTQAWSALYAGQSKKPTLPAHDFNKEHLLVIQRGYNTGGYSIGEVKALADGVNLSATVVVNEPGPNCVTSPAFAFPWVVVSVPTEIVAASVTEKPQKTTC